MESCVQNTPSFPSASDELNLEIQSTFDSATILMIKSNVLYKLWQIQSFPSSETKDQYSKSVKFRATGTNKAINKYSPLSNAST